MIKFITPALTILLVLSAMAQGEVSRMDIRDLQPHIDKEGYPALIVPLNQPIYLFKASGEKAHIGGFEYELRKDGKGYEYAFPSYVGVKLVDGKLFMDGEEIVSWSYRPKRE